MSETTNILSPDKDITILKWVVHAGSQISNGSILCLYELLDELGNDTKVQRLKNTQHCGLVKKLLYKEGVSIPKNSPIIEIEECLHTTIIKDLCADCGADLQQIDVVASSKASVPMIHSVPELKVSTELARKLGRADTDRLLKDRKLVLLVDLDQTLIHTTNDNVPSNLKDVYHFQLYGPNSPWYHTRLRPGTLAFLKNIDTLYELHICTFGARNYAHMICGFLDEKGRFFSHRILSRDECLNATSKKDNLKSLFPDSCGDSMVCIIDDREDVWNHATNLIQVKPYHFFQHTGDINAPPTLAKRELDGKGVDFNKIVKLQKIKRKKKSKDAKLLTEPPAPESEKKPEAEEKPKAEETSKSEMIPEAEEKTDSDKKPDAEEKPEKEKSTEESIETEKQPEPGSSQSSENITAKTLDTDETKDDSDDQNAQENQDDNLVEIQDPDDYLLYLEMILKSIHKRFYDTYDQTKEIPDLKVLIPKLKAEVLVGVSIVFSGLVPNIVKLEHSRPYLIAKNLGAEITESISDKTTHLVAASTGTQKVFQAQKNKMIQIVTPDWLWTCSERWEHVDEKLYPLTTNRPKQMRQVPAHCSPERIPEPDDAKFNNPYLQMCDDEIALMKQEVDDESTESEEDVSPPEAERPRRKRKRSNDVDHEDEPKDKIEILSAKADDGSDSSANESGKSGKSSDEDDSPSAKFRRGEEISSEYEIDSNDSVESVGQPNDEDDDGEWNMMGAALEREFLGIDD